MHKSVMENVLEFFCFIFECHSRILALQCFVFFLSKAYAASFSSQLFPSYPKVYSVSRSYIPWGSVSEAAGDALTLFPRGPVTDSPRRTVYKHTCVKGPLSL